MRTTAYFQAAALAACVFAAPAVAHAQTNATSAAAAEKLFQEGRTLMGDGKYADACPKLAESLRLDPAVGTALNLAECYEHVDKFASAWVTYRKAETMARRANQQERYTHAAARAEALEKSLSYITISVPSHPKGLAVTRDGEPVGEAAWGTAVPVDGGTHVVESSAPGRRTWKKVLQLAPRGAREKIELPELEHAPDVATDPNASTSGDTAFPLQRTAGWAAIATGAVALGVGVVFGFVAKSKNDDATTNHCSSVDCDARGVTLTQDAKSAALFSTILVATGGVLAVGGVVLVLTAPQRAAAPRVGLTLSPAAYGVWATF